MARTATKKMKRLYSKDRKSTPGYVILSGFSIPTHIHKMCTDLQRKKRDEGKPKQSIGDCITELLEELQTLKKQKQ